MHARRTAVVARAALLLVPFAIGACRREAPRVGVVDLLDFHQAGATGVFLNEALVLHFSGDLDRSSVTRASVSVVDDRGQAAAGRLAVDGARVTFTPDLPRSPALNDGGFRPGAEYHVAVRGFPFPDGVRGRDGEPLRASQRFRFRAVDAPGGPDEAVFAPPLVESPTYLDVASKQIGSVDPIHLTASQPLDPRSVTDGSFELLDLTTPLPVRVTLTENGPDGARIELRAAGEGKDNLRALERPWYVLRIADGAAPPRTLGGIPVQPTWLASRIGGARIDVVGRAKEHRVDFDTPRIWTAEAGSAPSGALATDRMWSAQPLEGVDGTAYWGDGEVTVRYPAAAGTGAAGEVSLSDLEPDAMHDLHATRLVLAPDATVELPPDGLVVLRSQGAMHLAGALRRAPAREAPPPPMRFPAGDNLSAWLARARAENHAWTVIVAGGDLFVEGVPFDDAGGIELAGPLLLVSGGRLRISDRLEASAIARLAPGGDVLPWALDWTRKPDERFRVDPPVTNQLVLPLRFGVQSASFRPPSGVTAWRSSRYGAWNGIGDVRVRWIGQRFTTNGFEEYGPLDDVLLLAGSDALRFTIELVLPAASESGSAEAPGTEAGKWDPPKVDYVEFRWDAPLPGAPAER